MGEQSGRRYKTEGWIAQTNSQESPRVPRCSFSPRRGASINDTGPVSLFSRHVRSRTEGHLSVHVTTLTPSWSVAIVPPPVRNTTLGFGLRRGKLRTRPMFSKTHSCPHSGSPSVCHSARSRFHGFCFRCNNLILVGRPGEVKATWTAQNRIVTACIQRPAVLHVCTANKTANPPHTEGVSALVLTQEPCLLILFE